MMQNTHPLKKPYERKLFGLRIINRFRKSDDGVAAIEFGMLALPFLLLIFAILETAIGFFAAQVFESGVDNIGRQIRTGQVQSSNTTSAEVRDAICARTWGMFNCENIGLDVRTFTAFPDVPLVTPRDAEGNLDTSAFVFDTGSRSTIVIVRAYYEWPVLIDYLWQNVGGLSNGNRLFVATAAFQNEPF